MRPGGAAGLRGLLVAAAAALAIWLVPWDAPPGAGSEPPHEDAAHHRGADGPSGAPNPVLPLQPAQLVLEDLRRALPQDPAAPPVAERVAAFLLLAAAAALAGHLAGRILGPGAGLPATALTLSAPPALVAASRVEGLLPLLATALMLGASAAALQGARTHRPRWLAAVMPLGALALLTHPLARGLPVVAFGLLATRNPRSSAVSWASPLLLLALLHVFLELHLAGGPPAGAASRAGPPWVAWSPAAALLLLGPALIMGPMRGAWCPLPPLALAGLGVLLPWCLLPPPLEPGRSLLWSGVLAPMGPLGACLAVGLLQLADRTVGGRGRVRDGGTCLLLVLAALASRAAAQQVRQAAELRAFALDRAAAAAPRSSTGHLVLVAPRHPPGAPEAFSAGIPRAFEARHPGLAPLVWVPSLEPGDVGPGALAALGFRPHEDRVLQLATGGSRSTGLRLQEMQQDLARRMRPTVRRTAGGWRLHWDFRRPFQAHAWYPVEPGQGSLVGPEIRGTPWGYPLYRLPAGAPGGLRSPPWPRNVRGRLAVLVVQGRPLPGTSAGRGRVVLVGTDGAARGSTPLRISGNHQEVPLGVLPGSAPGPDGRPPGLLLIPGRPGAQVGIASLTVIVKRG